MDGKTVSGGVTLNKGSAHASLVNLSDQNLPKDHLNSIDRRSPAPQKLDDRSSKSPNYMKKQSGSKLNSAGKLDVLHGGKLLFNLKITDLTRSDNPFVFYENQQVDDDGYLLF